ncbi:phospholipase D-like domain-containing protein [Chryseobacterium sp. A301]
MNQIITNGVEIKQRIISEINTASKNIYIAMAWFTDRDIANALINANSRGVDIDVILSSNSSNDVVKGMLREATIPIHAFDTDDERGIMHHKFCLLDNRISINGSYNYSYNASSNNVENIQVSDDPDTYRQLIREFERIKYAIDHKISVNSSKSTDNFITPEPVVATLGFQEESLQDLKSVLDNIIATEVGSLDKELLKNSGYNRAKENNGDHQVLPQAMDSLYSNFINEIEVIDEKKSRLKSKIEEQIKISTGNLESKTENEINTIKTLSRIESEKLQQNKIEIEKAIEKKEASILSNEKNQIPFLKEKIASLRQKLNELNLVFVKPPINWLKTILLSLLLILLTSYIFIFYSSVAYIFIFSKEDMMRTLTLGLANYEMPEIFNPHAITKIWSKGAGGVMFLFLFVTIPLALGMFKYLVDIPEKAHENWSQKCISKYGGFVLILLVDIFIAYKVSKNINTMDNLRMNKEVHDLTLKDMPQDSNFWLVFILGTLGIYLFSIVFEKIVISTRKRNITHQQFKIKIQAGLVQKDIDNLGENINSISKANTELNSDINLLQKDLDIIKAKIDSVPVNENEDINSLSQKLLTYIEKVTNLGNIFKSQVDNDKLPISKTEMENRVNIFMEGWSKYLHEFLSVNIAETKTQEAIHEIETWLNNLTTESK